MQNTRELADIGRRSPELPEIVADARASEKGLRVMTMKERLAIHRQIEMENHEHMEDFMCRLYWDSLSAEEVASMIQEKDRAMEWDEQFSFLCWLLEEKEGQKCNA